MRTKTYAPKPGSYTETVYNFLNENSDRWWTPKEVAEKLDMDYMQVYGALYRLGWSMKIAKPFNGKYKSNRTGIVDVIYTYLKLIPKSGPGWKRKDCEDCGLPIGLVTDPPFEIDSVTIKIGNVEREYTKEQFKELQPKHGYCYCGAEIR